jgi:hypothetical protein
MFSSRSSSVEVDWSDPHQYTHHRIRELEMQVSALYRQFAWLLVVVIVALSIAGAKFG